MRYKVSKKLIRLLNDMLLNARPELDSRSKELAWWSINKETMKLVVKQWGKEIDEDWIN